MKNKFIIGLVIICILVIGLIIFAITSICVKYPDLTDNAIVFKTGKYIDVNDDDGYLTIEYNGRTYMLYGTLKGRIKTKDINKCIGYIIQDEDNSSVIDENDKNTRVYTLTDDPDENYLMEYYIGTTLMNQPSFLRAIDTKGKDIFAPSYIGSLDYNYWEQ